MRGEQDSQVELLTTTSLGKRVPAAHPIREIKRLADQALAKELDPTFDAMYASVVRVARSRLRECWKAQFGGNRAVLGAFRAPVLQSGSNYDLLFRFFLGMNL